MLLDLVLSTIAFFVAVHFLRRYLEEQGMRKGWTRGLLIFVLASVISSLVSAAVEKLQGNDPTQSAAEIRKLLQP